MSEVKCAARTEDNKRLELTDLNYLFVDLATVSHADTGDPWARNKFTKY